MSVVRCHGEMTINGKNQQTYTPAFGSFLLIGKMANVVEEQREQQPAEPSPIVVQPIGSVPGEAVKADPPAATSLVQSLLQEQEDETGDKKKKKKKKKAKTGRQKELVPTSPIIDRSPSVSISFRNV